MEMVLIISRINYNKIENPKKTLYSLPVSDITEWTFFQLSFPILKKRRETRNRRNQKPEVLRKNEMLSGQHVLRELVDGCDVGQREASIA